MKEAKARREVIPGILKLVIVTTVLSLMAFTSVLAGVCTKTVTRTKQVTVTPPVKSDPDGDGKTPWERGGYKSPVGLEYVKLCTGGKGKRCKSSINPVDLDNPPSGYLRAKLKRKGKTWYDVKVDYHCSSDKEFGDEDDVFLGSEEKKLTKDKYRNKKGKSVYLRVKQSDLKKCLTESGRNYYLFAVVNFPEYPEVSNASTENDGSEHVRLVVPSKPRVETVLVTETVTVQPEVIPYEPQSETQPKPSPQVEAEVPSTNPSSPALTAEQLNAVLLIIRMGFLLLEDDEEENEREVKER